MTTEERIQRCQSGDAWCELAEGRIEKNNFCNSFPLRNLFEQTSESTVQIREA